MDKDAGVLNEIELEGVNGGLKPATIRHTNQESEARDFPPLNDDALFKEDAIIRPRKNSR